MDPKFQELKAHMQEIQDLKAAVALLSWDQMTYMPPGGAAARGRQMATLEKLAHEKMVSPELGGLLDELRPRLSDLPEDSMEARLLRVAARDYDKEKKIPASFLAELSEHSSTTYEAWVKARAESKFQIVAPLLEKTLELSRRMADFYPGYQHIIDPLIDYFDEGINGATIRALFAELRGELIPLLREITSRKEDETRPRDACLRQYFPESGQWQFCLEIARALGYNFENGRQDKSPHPFTTTFSIGDVRITTRIDENYLGEALFSTIHETGHALYEQGIGLELEGTWLASGASLAVHESQSRLWENLVGRRRDFWEFFFPRLREIFPQQLRQTSLEEFYRAINMVKPSLIRTDADEVTYNLHVMIRFQLEMDLLEGRLKVRDLPEAWNEAYREFLGVAPPDDRLGVLQDMHWYSGTIGGYFQSYTMGNIMSAQFFDAAVAAAPQIPAEIRQGNFQTLHEWLRQNIYQYGRKYMTREIVQRVTGDEIRIESYVKYLKRKYGEIYNF
ncbi:MAG: carboxypeptidase M32 [Firmicutes bacterium]|nr:carboxypeptidase M32 [Bacillota bacterium]